MGSFVQPPFYNLKVSPLGVIPKKQPGESRMIHHLSFPYGGSVNDFFPAELCSVHYASVDDVANEAPSRKSGKMPIGNSQFAWEEESHTERAPIRYWLIEFYMLGGNCRESFSSEGDQSYYWH